MFAQTTNEQRVIRREFLWYAWLSSSALLMPRLVGLLWRMPTLVFRRVSLAVDSSPATLWTFLWGR